MPNPGGPVDGVGQGGRRGIDHDFADGFGAEGARWLIAVLEFHPQFPHIQPGGQFILHERGADGASFLIVADVLRQSMADALHDAAFRLNPGQGGVDGNPAVHNGHVVQNGDQAGLLIQLDLHHAHHIGRRGDGRGVACGDLCGRSVEYLGFIGDFLQADHPVSVDLAHPFALEDNILGFTTQHVRRDGADLFLQLGACFFHGLSGHIGSGRSVGAGIVRRGVGIRSEDRHVVYAAVHAFGRHLSQNRVAPGSHVRRADDQVVGAVLAEF